MDRLPKYWEWQKSAPPPPDETWGLMARENDLRPKIGVGNVPCNAQRDSWCSQTTPCIDCYHAPSSTGGVTRGISGQTPWLLVKRRDRVIGYTKFTNLVITHGRSATVRTSFLSPEMTIFSVTPLLWWYTSCPDMGIFPQRLSSLHSYYSHEYNKNKLRGAGESEGARQAFGSIPIPLAMILDLHHNLAKQSVINHK